MADFDPWAPYYDLIHKGLPGEAEFYVGQAIKRGGPVLEIGCGTGRIAIPIALSGVDVAGLDNSGNMLALCREKMAQIGETPGALTLIDADMRDFSLHKQYPLILMTYRTFMHCLTPEEQLACLACIHEHLTPGGALFLNVWAANAAALFAFPASFQEDTERLLECMPVPGEDIVLEHFYTAWRDDFRQVIHERHSLREVDSDGNQIHEEALRMTRAWFTPREMEHLLCRAGFEIEAVLGDFDGAPLGPEHKEMVWHVRRPQ